MPKFIGLDTETVIHNHIHTFFSFQLYSNDVFKDVERINDKIRVYSENSVDLEKYLTRQTNRAWFVCFNLSFDGLVISNVLKDRGYEITCVLAGSRITRVTIKRGKLKWILCDLRNIFPNTSLEGVGKSLKILKMDKPEYLGKREPNTVKERLYFREYAMRDAEICYKGAKMVQEEFNTFRTTCAGLAIRVFKRDHVKFPKFYHYNELTESKFRLAYHGGRTECFIRGTNPEKIDGYDINSLYPYVMREKKYPDVTKKIRLTALRKPLINLDHEGIAHVKITCDTDFPPICAKTLCKDGLEKLVFANGVLDGWFTYPELRLITDENIGEITREYECYEWKNVFRPFKEYIDKFYALKEEATKTDSPKKNLYKIMLNSTYGKFGEHGSCRFIGLDGVEITSDREAKLKIAWYHSPVLAAYITAYARLENWKWLNRIDKNKIYYTDTDCFYTSEDLSCAVGSKIGDLKKEVTIKPANSIFIRSKFYMVNEKLVLKGFKQNISYADFVQMLYNEDFRIPQHRILKMLEAQRLGKIPLTDCTIMKKFSVEPDGKRIFKEPLTSKTLFVQTSFSTPLNLSS